MLISSQISAYYIIGKHFYVMVQLAVVLSPSLVGLPFGIWLTFGWDMRLYGLWIGLTVSLIYCALFGTWLCLRTDWNREVWKIMKRLQDQVKARGAGDEESHLPSS